MSNSKITRERIAAIEPRIRPYVRHTPVMRVDMADFGRPPFAVDLKLECLQHSGSFKARGAFTNLLERPVPAAGVVAASGGNHGAAVAAAAQALGVPAEIFVPTITAEAKRARIRAHGATLVVGGAAYDEAREASEARAAEFGGLPGRPYDPCYHRACDTADNIDPVVVQQMSDALLHAIRAVAAAPDGRMPDAP